MAKAGTGAGSATAWYIMPSDRLLARWFNVLHWPFTAWHLSYVAIGVAVADQVRWDVLGWTVLAFFLAMGVGAHCLDLVRGDPLALRLSRGWLIRVGVYAIAGAVAIGVWQVVSGNVPPVVMVLIPIGVLMAVGYNLEWRWMHGDVQFAFFWAVFPFSVGLAATGHSPSWVPQPTDMFLAFVFLTAYAQRVLSTRARYLRRQITEARVYLSPREMPEGLTRADELRLSHPGPEGGRISRWPSLEQDKAWLLEPIDQALMIMSFAMPALAVAMLLWRL